MPSAKKHKKACTNALGAFDFIVDEYPDWGAVALFYAAVHCVERLCAEDGVHNPDHASRKRYIIQNYSSIWPEYNKLKGESTKARYLEHGGFSLSADRVRSQLHEKAYKVVEAEVDQRVEAIEQKRKSTKQDS